MKTTNQRPSRRSGRPGAGRRGVSRGAFSRRTFLGGTAAAGGVVLTRADAAAAPGKVAARGPGRTTVVLEVNGKKRKLAIEPRVTLLRALRNHLGLTGAKEICDRGACGGCSVLVDGALVNSCMMLALDAVGRKVTTVEGVAPPGELHPLQKAFVEKDALQCGFCTPGMVMACKALLDRNPRPSLVEIKRGLAGNLCRCGTYPRIFSAVLSATATAPSPGKPSAASPVSSRNQG